jgi:hypothetical protein
MAHGAIIDARIHSTGILPSYAGNVILTARHAAIRLRIVPHVSKTAISLSFRKTNV